MCNLYKSEMITIRVNGNIYYAPIKQIYQTFHNKKIEVFYDGNWYAAKIIGEASEKDLVKISDSLICSLNLKIKTPTGSKEIIDFINSFNNAEKPLHRSIPITEDPIENYGEIYKLSEICLNTSECKTIGTFNQDTKYYLGNIEFLEEKSDWLFGVEFEDPNNQYYTLTNGFIISTK